MWSEGCARVAAANEPFLVGTGSEGSHQTEGGQPVLVGQGVFRNSRQTTWRPEGLQL